MTRFSVYSLYISQMHGSHAWVTCISLRACISLPRAHTSVGLDSEAPSQQSKTRALDYMGKRSGPTAGACYEKANALEQKNIKRKGLLPGGKKGDRDAVLWSTAWWGG